MFERRCPSLSLPYPHNTQFLWDLHECVLDSSDKDSSYSEDTVDAEEDEEEDD